MTHTPRLLAGKRRTLATMLAVLALGEALLAVVFAATLDQLLAETQAPVMPLLAACGLALMAGAAMLLGRWVGEDFAQSFVADCREAIFAAVTRQPVDGKDARWLTVLINDMAALRNYALRGTVRLWTSAIAAGAAALWAGMTMPQLLPGLIPLAVGAGTVTLMVWPLTRAITAQRQLRGRMNRFLVRRVRAELAGNPSAKGHGFRKLNQLSSDLARASVRRAGHAGVIDAAPTIAGLTAALVLVWQTVSSQDTTGLAGGLMLLGFIGARLLEAARALHARIGGTIALDRLNRLLASAPPRRINLRPRSGLGASAGRTRKIIARLGRLLPLRISLNPALPAPQRIPKELEE